MNVDRALPDFLRWPTRTAARRGGQEGAPRLQGRGDADGYGACQSLAKAPGSFILANRWAHCPIGLLGDDLRRRLRDERSRQATNFGYKVPPHHVPRGLALEMPLRFLEAPIDRREMSEKEAGIEVQGKVEEASGGLYRVKVDQGPTVLAYASGKMKRFRIRIITGDRVKVELSPYDLTRGRITYRDK
jgi:translation initiation factor IF-1